MSIFVVLCGWAGAGLLLAAYALLSTDRIGKGLTFQALNFCGSLGVAMESFESSAYPAGTLNTIWMVIAMGSMMGIWLNSRHQDGTPV